MQRAAVPRRPWIRAALAALGVTVVLSQQHPAAAQAVATDFVTAPPGDAAFGVQAPDARGAGTLRMRALASYALNPLALLTERQKPYRVVADHLWFEGAASLALSHRYLIGFSLPVLAEQSGEPLSTEDALPEPASAPALGDLRLTARARLLGPAGNGWQLAAGAEVWLPTGGDAAYASDGELRGRGFITTGSRFERSYWSVEAGAYYRPARELPGILPTRVGSMLTFGAAAGFALDSRGALSVGPEVQGLFTVTGGAELLDPRSTVLHLLVGSRYRMSSLPLELSMAAGPGLAQGPGSADFRGLLAVTWSPEQPPPPPDSDGDGVPDQTDVCLNLPGVASEDPLMNGCPELPLDTDGDSIPDAFDACPRTPGEPSNSRRTHGCPKPVDSDGDGIVDPEDACPHERGIRQEDPARNGCPAPAPPKAELVARAIAISEQVQFETGTAVLRPESDSILSEVAKVLRENPELSVEVQGHTDNTGTPELNRKLAQDRADSVVRWLVDHGIERKRLTAKGYGQDRPIADNATEEGRTRNRRVEFRVIPRPGPAPAGGAQ